MFAISVFALSDKRSTLLGKKYLHIFQLPKTTFGAKLSYVAAALLRILKDLFSPV